MSLWHLLFIVQAYSNYSNKNVKIHFRLIKIYKKYNSEEKLCARYTLSDFIPCLYKRTTQILKNSQKPWFQRHKQKKFSLLHFLVVYGFHMYLVPFFHWNHYLVMYHITLHWCYIFIIISTSVQWRFLKDFDLCFSICNLQIKKITNHF